MIYSIFKKITLYLYSRLIIAELRLRYFFYKNLYYNESNGFGDSFQYYLKNYLKIIKRNTFCLSFGFLNDLTAHFFFKPEKVKKLFFTIPERVYYSVIRELITSKYYKPILNYNFEETYLPNNKDSYKNLLKIFTLRKKNKDFDFSKKYICMSIKHYSDDLTEINNSSSRQCVDLNKVCKLISFIHKKNIAVVFFNKSYELSTLKLKEYYKKKSIEKKPFFFCDYDNYENLANQLSVFDKSLGYLGTDGGILSIFYLLKKKSLVFDTCFTKKTIGFLNKSFIRYLYKKKISKTGIFNFQFGEKIFPHDYIVDVKYEEIIKELNFILLD